MRRIAGRSEGICIAFRSRPGTKPLLMRAAGTLMPQTWNDETASASPAIEP